MADRIQRLRHYSQVSLPVTLDVLYDVTTNPRQPPGRAVDALAGIYTIYTVQNVIDSNSLPLPCGCGDARRVNNNVHISLIHTIGSKKRSWNGRIQDHATVLGIDLDICSIGAIHLSSPLSSRSFLALLRSRTGW